jgi:hypothetical protein
MTELEELTNEKTLEELKNELRFQLRQGESLGGAICSEIVFEIEKNI